MSNNSDKDAPSDEQLNALGRLAFEFGRLDLHIQMLIWAMAGLYPLSTSFAGALTREMSTFARARTMEALSLQLWEKDSDMQKSIAKLAKKYRKSASKRGSLIHSFWVTPDKSGHSQALNTSFKPGEGFALDISPRPPEQIIEDADYIRKRRFEAMALMVPALKRYSEFAQSLRDKEIQPTLRRAQDHHPEDTQ